MSDFAYPLHEECGVFGIFRGTNSPRSATPKHDREKNLFKKAKLSCNRAKKMVRYSYINVGLI